MVQDKLQNMTPKEIEEAVRYHNELYFVKHRPEISDYEFDRLVEQLKKVMPDSKILHEITSDLSTLTGQKVKHDVPMLSLDKCYDAETLEKWAEKFEGKVIVSPKIDGLAISIRYGNDGRMVQAATRGNGIEGEDVTANIKYIEDIPLKVELKNVEVRGEVYMPLSVFERYKAQFANPRNLAAGAIKQKNPKKTGDYTLSFLGYDLLPCLPAGRAYRQAGRNTGAKTEEEKRELLRKNKIKTVDGKIIDKKDMKDAYEYFLSNRNKLDYETDGVVFKANDVSAQDELGITAHHPRYAIAYKFQGDSGITTLKDVEWSVARTGVITPVGIVEPVQLSGATVTRVSLHNYGLMKEMGLSHGAKVMMMRRGGVIPNLESVVEAGDKPIEAPNKCPSCGSNIELRDDFLYCTNSASCLHTKMAELGHFIKVVEIDGIGEKLIEQLYANGFVTDPSEFYELTKDDLMSLDRMGDVLATKLIKNIQSKNKIPLDLFLTSLGIKELGKHVAKILAEFGSLEKIFGLDRENLADIHTIGETIAENVSKGLKDKRKLIEKLLKHVKIIEGAKKAKGGKLSGKSFLFTGSLSSMDRKDAQRLVEENGGIAANGVVKDLNYLVVGDGAQHHAMLGSAQHRTVLGSKLDKANTLISKGSSLKIISEKEFLEMVKKD